MRLFAAFDLSDEALQAAAEWWSAASLELPASEWRDVDRRNWHLTLAFYGDIPGADIDTLADQLGSCAEETSPFTLRFTPPGVFPKISRARVFWLGAEADDVDALRRVARCCRRAGFETGVKRTEKVSPFHAHITLARRRGFPEALDPAIFADMPSPPDLDWQADAISLYRSELAPEGARYHLVERFLLAE